MIKNKTILTAILLLTSIAFAQVSQDSLFLSTAPDGIFVIWSKYLDQNETRTYEGFNIYRATENSKTKKINAKPIECVKSMKDLEEIVGKEGVKFILDYSNYTENEVLEMFENLDTALLGLMILNPMIMHAAGYAYYDKSIDEEKTYTYQLKGIKGGKESDVLATSSITHGEVPWQASPPDSFIATPLDGRVLLSWKPDTSNRNTFKYQIYRSVGEKSKFRPIMPYPTAILQMTSDDTLTWGSFEDTDVENGKTYYYYVVPMDILGNPGASSPILYAIPHDQTAPKIPQKLISASSLNGITLSWEPVSDMDVLGYLVFRSDEQDSGYTLISEPMVSSNFTVWEDNDVETGREYYYKIKAVDKNGNYSKLSAPTWGIFKNVRPPARPQGLTAKPTEKGVLLEWIANTEIDVKGYYLYRAKSEIDTALLISKRIEETNYIDTSKVVHPDMKYWYFVKAINKSDIFSKFSYPAVGTRLDTIKPQAPLGLRGYKDVPGIKLFWDTPKDMTIIGWNLYKRIDGDTEYMKVNPKPIAALITDITDRNVEKDMSYEYYIVAVDDHGIESEPSPSIVIETEKRILSAVKGIWVSHEKMGIEVHWDKSLQNNVDGYNVYRRTSNSDFKKLNNAILSIETKSFKDPSPEKGIRYYYSVRAVSNKGKEGRRSREIPIVP